MKVSVGVGVKEGVNEAVGVSVAVPVKVGVKVGKRVGMTGTGVAERRGAKVTVGEISALGVIVGAVLRFTERKMKPRL